MKQISIISILLFFLSCSNKQDKFKESVTAYIKQNTGDPSSYEPIEWGKLDTLYANINTDFVHDYNQSHAKRFQQEINLNEIPLKYNMDRIIAEENYQRALKLKVESDSLTKLSLSYYDSIKSILYKDSIYVLNFKPKFCGYSICHKFRAKNGFGALVLNENFFTVDTNYLNVKVFSKDEWEKNMLNVAR